MYTVYGIYINGSDVPVYVGKTQCFSARIFGHRGKGSITLRQSKQHRGIGVRMQLKALITQMGKMGDIQIAYTPIAVYESAMMAKRTERRMIHWHRPVLNTWVPKSRNYIAT